MEQQEPTIIIKYSSYTPAQKRATQKYRANNKDKVNEQRKKYYLERKEKDDGFLEYKRQKAKEYYQRKKEQKQANQINIEEQIQEPVIEQPIELEIVEPVAEVKPKRTRKTVKKEEETKEEEPVKKTRKHKSKEV